MDISSSPSSLSSHMENEIERREKLPNEILYSTYLGKKCWGLQAIALTYSWMLTRSKNEITVGKKWQYISINSSYMTA